MKTQAQQKTAEARDRRIAASRNDSEAPAPQSAAIQNSPFMSAQRKRLRRNLGLMIQKDDKTGEAASLTQAFFPVRHALPKAAVPPATPGKVVMRKTSDLSPHYSDFKPYTSFWSPNCWNTLRTAINDYTKLKDEDYSGRDTALQKIKNAMRQCGEKAIEFKGEKQDSAIEKLGSLKKKITAEQDEISVSGRLDPQGNVPLTDEPKATVCADPGTVNDGTELYADETCNTLVRTLALIKDTSAINQKQPSAFPTRECFIIEKTLTACKIVVWEREIHTMEQQTNKITMADRREGWVKKADCLEDTIQYRTVLDLDGATDVDKANAPLFSRQPAKEDIVQAGLADCYLMAALIGIVAKDHTAIEKMMKDNGDGSVTIQFYDIAGTTQKPTYTPKFVRVKKSIVQVGGQDAYAGGALWVRLVEKGFAAAGFTGKKGNQTPTQKALTPSYGEVEFGMADLALGHLLGSSPQEQTLESKGGEIPSGISSKVSRLPWAKEEIEAHTPLKNSQDKANDYKGLASFHILGNDTGKTDLWFTFLGSLGKNLSEIVEARAQKGADKKTYQAEIRLEDFEAVFKEKSLDGGVTSTLVAWMTTHKLYPGKRGTGKYSNHQITLFDGIVTALQGRNAVTLSSRKEVARAGSGIGRTGGESMAKGLAGPHVYGVLDYGFGSGKTHNPNDGEQRWLKLRNPWAQYGRDYIKKKGSPGILTAVEVQGGTGEFWLELSDVTKRFKSSSAAAIP